MEKIKTLDIDFVVSLQKEALVFTLDDDQCNISTSCLSELIDTLIDIEVKLKKEKQNV